MKPILILRHVAHEPAGTLETALVEAGLAVRYIDLFTEVPDRLDIEQAAALVVMGGPMNVDETERYPFLASEVAWIQRALAADVPVMGICLGAQLLAKALGARVYPLSRGPTQVKEIGWYEIELTPEAADDPLFGQRGQSLFRLRAARKSLVRSCEKGDRPQD